MAWLGIIFHLEERVIHRVWIHFIPTSLYPRRRKTFGLSWNRTQVLLLYVHKQPDDILLTLPFHPKQWTLKKQNYVVKQSKDFGWIRQ